MTVAIGGVKFDLLKQFDTESTLEVTSHPVEEGADISDHARLNNPQVGMTLLLKGDDADYRLGQLESRQRNKLLVGIIGPKRYTHMQITSIRPNYDYQVADGYVVDVTLQQVRVSKARTVVLGKTNSGRKQTKSKKASLSAAQLNKLANEVIRGNWGNGAERKKRLTKAGYNYNEIQAKVNAKLR